MSLIPFEDFYPEHRYGVLPLFRSRPLVSSVFHEGFRELQQLERELGQLNCGLASENGGFTFRCNVAGYLPEELKVNVEDNELVITGEHKHNGEQQSMHRTFMRRVKLPETIHKETIECNLDEKGRLEVTADHKDAPKVARQSIPIGFKQSTPQAINSGSKSTAEEKKK